jgi:ferredoxin--NADP+ reductase
MTYVITQNCCNDTSCVQACPVGCIHPTPDESGFATAEMLYIDPAACIDCAACVDACPVDAVYAEDELPKPLMRYTEINAAYFRANPVRHLPLRIAERPRIDAGRETLRVAIVGAGPSGFYAADELLRTAGMPVEVSMFDRLPTPFGLVRAGVAPDHPHTKEITGLFRWVAAQPNVHTFYNVEVGVHLTHEDLLAHHHAVIYAFGASHSRRLGVPGEELPGSHSATDFVAWYNGHPDFAGHVFDLSGKRAVVVGNGNVALDIARILLRDIDQLAKTDIADHALAALAESSVEEVVLLGRRDPSHAAYTAPELLAFGSLPGVDVVVDPRELPSDDAAVDFPGRLKASVLQELAAAGKGTGDKRLVLRFLASPLEILGASRVEQLRIVRNRMVTDDSGAAVAEATTQTETLTTGLVLRSIGYRGRGLPGLPFDEPSGTLPNAAGRVTDPITAQAIPGTYAAGWIKRGPSGVIGTNRADSGETVSALLDDHHANRLPRPVGSAAEFAELVARRRSDRVSRVHWQRIDEYELSQGRLTNRPRVKLTDHADLMRVAGLADR